MANMGDSGFCITLPCNASMSVYPDNQISNYRTKLAKPIDLKGDWEVGLVEFQYPRTWKTFDDADATFIVNDKKLGKTTQITLPTGYYNNISMLIGEINFHLTTHSIVLGYDQIRHKVYIKTRPGVGLIFDGKLAIILGLKPGVMLESAVVKTSDQETFQKQYAPHVADIYGAFYTFYVYTDIIDYQTVGDSFVPLLRCVHISGNNNDVVTVRYNKPHYVSTTKTHITDIAIEVKTDQNQHVNFSYGKVVAKLHFRPVKHPIRF